MATEVFKLAFKNVGRRKKRAALTMLGIFIGIAAVVALISLGEGLQKTINDQFEKVGADKIMIQAKEAGGFGGEHTPGQLTSRELDIVDKAHGVTQVGGALFRAVQVEFNDLQRTIYGISVPETSKEVALMDAVNTWEAEEGRLLAHRDNDKAVIGYNLANKLTFQKNMRVGDKVIVEGKVFDVVGILKRLGDPTIDGGISLPEADMRELLDAPEMYSYIVAQSAKSEDPEEVAERIRKVMRRDRHLKEGKEDFTVQTSTELIESFNAVLNIIQAVFVGIALISLLVGGIGIMNTMYTAVLERTREIGVMKAIGARNSDVLGMFLIESGLLGAAGGAIGIVIGMGISKLVEFGANSAFGAGTIIAVFPPYLVFGALIFSFVVGALSGVLPARRASRLKPVDALRSE